MKMYLKTLTIAAALTGAMVTGSAAPADAQNSIVRNTGDTARACVNRHLCPAPLANAIRAWDRAGWEMGNTINRRQGLPQVPYPGMRR
jgi:hypothetical protein